MRGTLDSAVRALVPEDVIAPVTQAIEAEAPGRWPVSVATCSRHSNDRAEVRFDDGRTLILKRARHAWARERFRASRAAARLLADAGIPAPRPLPVRETPGALPVEAYWKVELPTLDQVWDGADRARRAALLRGWGRLVRRIHAIGLPGHGPLLRPHPGGPGAWLRDDVRGRLLPAVAYTWPAARATVEALGDAVDRLEGRIGGAPAVLVHNDLHAGNVLCAADGGECAGVLDLEAALAGPAEADVAHMEVLHGPLFGRPLPTGWRDEVLRGYGRAPDPVALAFFRAYHLANLGYHAALRGLGAHAEQVLAAAAHELRAAASAPAVPSRPGTARARRSAVPRRDPARAEAQRARCP